MAGSFCGQEGTCVLHVQVEFEKRDSHIWVRRHEQQNPVDLFRFW